MLRRELPKYRYFMTWGDYLDARYNDPDVTRRLYASDWTHSLDDIDADAIASAAAGLEKQRPAAPEDLRTLAYSKSTVALEWSAPMHHTDIAAYDVYVDSVYYATTGDTSITIRGLEPGSSYAVTIRAADTSGRYSALSPTLNMRTRSDRIR